MSPPEPIASVEQRVEETRRFQRRLYTAPAVRPGVRLLRRLIWAVALFLLVFGILWLDRGGLRDNHDGVISLIDTVYFTFVTITTVGYGDIVPVTDRARLIDAVLVTPARLMFIMIFVGTAYELVIQRWVEGFRMARLQAHLRDHILICGFGAVGRMAARELLARGIPVERIVVLDPQDEALEAAADLKLTGLRGDASRADVLQDAAVERARGVIVCAGNDAINALIGLSVRRSSRARVVVAAEGFDTTDILRHSGADAVVSPPTLGGYVLANALESPQVTDLLVDMLTAHGEVEWDIVDVTPADIEQGPGRRQDCVVIAVRRAGAVHWPWQPAAQRLQASDQLVVVRPTPGARASTS